MVDTIERVSYNTKERKKYYKDFLTVKKEAEALRTEIYAIEDDAEFERRESEILAAGEKICKAYNKCFAAQFHRCKNEWFAKIIEELNDEQYKSISEKQYYFFRQYASDTDKNNWRDGKSYCRVGDYLVTLVWHNSLRAIKKEKIYLSAV